MRRPFPLFASAGAIVAAGLAAGFAGCAQSPPAAPSGAARPASMSGSPAPVVPPSAPRAGSADGAGAATPAPAADTAGVGGPSAAPRIPKPAPAPAGVAARFPEPAVAFATPAFAAGRDDFTRSDEIRAALDRLAREPRAGRRGEVRLLEIGSSRGGEPIVAVAFGGGPVAAGSSRRPSVLLVAGQHGDEPAGSEALLLLAERLAAGQRDRVLDKVDVVIVPLANPDGRALFQRDTGDGIDLNRDHLALRTPEAQALAQLTLDRQPDVVADFHEYSVDGAFAARFAALPRFDVLLQNATVANLPPLIGRAAEEWFRQPLAASLAASGYATDWYHTVADGPGRSTERRVSMGGSSAAIGRNAAGLRNAVSLLVETRGGGLGRVDLKRRVQAALIAAESVLDSAAARGADLQKLRDFTGRDVAAKACQGEAVIDAAPTPSEYSLAMLDPESGAIRRVTVAWDSALELRVLRSRPRPCGYWLAASQGDAVSRLRRLGVDVQQLDEAGDVRGETWRELSRERAAASTGTEAEPPRLRVQAQPVLLDVPAGSYYVSLEQPLANLAIAALEPDSPAGFVAAGVIGNVADTARVLARPTAKMTPAP